MAVYFTAKAISQITLPHTCLILSDNINNSVVQISKISVNYIYLQEKCVEIRKLSENAVSPAKNTILMLR
jgi:hypothetical protein